MNETNRVLVAKGGEAVDAGVRRVGPRVGRNELCPCGSGRKAKRCCRGSGERVTVERKLVEAQAAEMAEAVKNYQLAVRINGELNQENARLHEELKRNAASHARQCDLAREAETRVVEICGIIDRDGDLEWDGVLAMVRDGADALTKLAFVDDLQRQLSGLREQLGSLVKTWGRTGEQQQKLFAFNRDTEYGQSIVANRVRELLEQYAPLRYPAPEGVTDQVGACPPRGG